MACNTLIQSSSRLTVAMGALPEGFCPSNFQEFADALAQRLIISSGQNNSTFVAGPTEPTSNQGPWLKDCEEWFVFDESTGVYRPITKGGFNTLVYITSSTDFVVPAFIYKLKVQIWGGGGGGLYGGAASNAGGGAGAYALKIFNVTPGQVITATVGAGGTGGVAPTAGGTTTFSTMSATGGSPSSGQTAPGAGGAATGGDQNISGGSGDFGATGASAHNGPGGNSPNGGNGGVGSGTQAIADGDAPGGGGAGGLGGNVAGNGANGAILIEY